jgi:hypothetical protein
MMPALRIRCPSIAKPVHALRWCAFPLAELALAFGVVSCGREKGSQYVPPSGGLNPTVPDGGGALHAEGGAGSREGAQGAYPPLAPDRSTTWNLAGMSSRGGIPSAGWRNCRPSPLAPSGGDDSKPINDAIAHCPEGTVVILGPGTFTMGKGHYIAITKGVVLRGSGAGATILRNPLNLPATRANKEAADTSPIAIVGPGRWVNPDGDRRCVGPTPYQPKYMQLLSADGSKGSHSVTVADASIFSVGQTVLLDETSGASWQPDVARVSTSIWASPDYAVTWQVHSPHFGADDPVQTGVTSSPENNYAGSGSGSDAACWFSRQDRPQNEIKEVASVSGNTVTFTSPLHKDYRTNRHAELTTYTGGNRPLQNAGIEELTAAGGGNGGIRFENVAYSWAKNVEVTGWYGEGVALDGAFRVEVRDSYIHDAAWAEPGGAGYAISFAGASSEVLLENNISIKANKVIVARSSGTGSVVAYNYMDDGYIATSERWIEVGLNASHMVGSHHVLFEGNQSFNIDSDTTHGNSTYHTFFRNWATGVRAKFESGFSGNTIDDATTANGPKRAAGALRYSYWMSYVGNALGTPGLTTVANGYVDTCDDMTCGHHAGSVWLLGWNDLSPYTLDPKVRQTAIQDGNWDYFLGQQTWLTHPATVLPDSLYLPNKPAFFGGNPWPWVDPATGTTAILPAHARYAAGTPNVVP